MDGKGPDRNGSTPFFTVNASGTTPFTKRYADPARAAEAAAHHRWLSELKAVAVPALLEETESDLIFENIDGRHAEPGDLVAVAATMGTLHAAAWSTHLHQAELHKPFRCGDLTIADFLSPRRRVLARFPEAAALRPAALYKDSNVRNFLITERGVTVIDFDDLTLAPFGYDLAKLIVSSAMTYGRPDPASVADALEAYNARIPASAACPHKLLRVYTDIHHELTAPYLNRHGYRYRWPEVSPWPAA